jgi:hypothetical protein
MMDSIVMDVNRVGCGKLEVAARPVLSPLSDAIRTKITQAAQGCPTISPLLADEYLSHLAFLQERQREIKIAAHLFRACTFDIRVGLRRGPARPARQRALQLPRPLPLRGLVQLPQLRECPVPS